MEAYFKMFGREVGEECGAERWWSDRFRDTGK